MVFFPIYLHAPPFDINEIYMCIWRRNARPFDTTGILKFETFFEVIIKRTLKCLICVLGEEFLKLPN